MIPLEYHYSYTTKSYIISYLSSYMILLGFHWKLWVVWVIGVLGWWYGLVMVSRDSYYRRDTKSQDAVQGGTEKAR